LLTGSIIRPRIVISTSIVTSDCDYITSSPTRLLGKLAVTSTGT
jgi:hypothetical protein